jgi:AhpD family alkylhydroperoxidase
MSENDAAVGHSPKRTSATTHLEELIPIAVVIAAGCESCAEKMVHRALERGSSAREIDRTLAIVANLKSLGCLAEAVGPEVVERMAGPLRAGRKALDSEACCGEGGRTSCEPGPRRSPEPEPIARAKG